MKRSTKKTPRLSTAKFGTILLIVLVLGAAAGLIIMKRSHNKLSDSSTKTTSTVASAQSNFTSNDTTKVPGDTSARDKVSGGITDTNGSSSTPANASDSTSSSNGEIVVYAPTKNSLLTSGATVSGTSSLSKVSYRIVDTEVGMISTGTLNVVDGKFSGTIQFQTNAKSGQLDFFGTQNDGNEFDNLSIPVNFR